MQQNGTYNPRERYDNDPSGQGSHGRARLRPFLRQRARPVPLDLRRTRASRRQVLSPRRFSQLCRSAAGDLPAISRRTRSGAARQSSMSPASASSPATALCWNMPATSGTSAHTRSRSQDRSRTSKPAAANHADAAVVNGEAIPVAKRSNSNRRVISKAVTNGLRQRVIMRSALRCAAASTCSTSTSGNPSPSTHSSRLAAVDIANAVPAKLQRRTGAGGFVWSSTEQHDLAIAGDLAVPCLEFFRRDLQRTGNVRGSGSKSSG